MIESVCVVLVKTHRRRRCTSLHRMQKPVYRTARRFPTTHSWGPPPPRTCPLKFHLPPRPFLLNEGADQISRSSRCFFRNVPYSLTGPIDCDLTISTMLVDNSFFRSTAVLRAIRKSLRFSSSCHNIFNLLDFTQFFFTCC